jgi:hypothetical protein
MYSSLRGRFNTPLLQHKSQNPWQNRRTHRKFNITLCRHCTPLQTEHPQSIPRSRNDQSSRQACSHKASWEQACPFKGELRTLSQEFPS